ncbi:hypothetical protein [Burkholderia pseudomallei]|uniref:hypothetical protein n=1 Tax=Burkholderia pseudomallei TaxID=28450 RepID=UPI0021160736|nr:hypothetical protein [Burkholderia pseudomallei]
MEEMPEQRSVRRAMSAWLTKQINNVAAPDGIATPAVRAQVLGALEDINTRIVTLNRSLQEKYHLAENRDLVKFYMKGGNAFECIHDPNGAAAQRNGGGTSDWDTQIVVDPWAPVPLQAIIYGELEELVTDAMIKAGVEISLVAEDFITQTGHHWAVQGADLDGRNLSAYTLEYDVPQSLRRVFDQQRLGLWTNDRRPVSDPRVPNPERIPGILLNDAIRPFILHRLGYTWHARLAPPSDPPKTDVGDIRKPILMELIDVTLPRRDTIEAVAVWEELVQKHISIEPSDVAVDTPDNIDSPRKKVRLPLPDIMYHLREIATMLCEIADSSSHHQDKLEKRFARFKLIWDSSSASQQQNITHAIGALAGVDDIYHAPPEHVASVTDAINTYGGTRANAILQDGDPAYGLARNLMDRIADRTAATRGDFTERGHVSRERLASFDAARATLRQRIDRAVARLPTEIAVGVLDAAFSDDLVLIRVLEQSEYVEPRQIGFSGVLMAVVIRVENQLQLDILSELFRTGFDPRFVDTRISTSVRFRTYSVPRATGITHEMTMVVFEAGKAAAYLTITTATPGEAPFRRDAAYPGLDYASLPEIAAQRKVAAALIEDYLVRKTISRQYEALKTLLPVV